MSRFDTDEQAGSFTGDASTSNAEGTKPTSGAPSSPTKIFGMDVVIDPSIPAGEFKIVHRKKISENELHTIIINAVNHNESEHGSKFAVQDMAEEIIDKLRDAGMLEGE